MILFFEPIIKEKIWGWEYWGISAHPNGQSVVRNGRYKGKTLGELWKDHRELFGGILGEKFPLLIKKIDANEDLSVQVHPEDEYAIKYENGELGKTECWYILDCKPDGEMVYGVNVESKEELDEMIDKGQWDKLLRNISIKKGDFLYIPSGTVHALKAGTQVLEIQQNSDTTYRLYDYDRRDSQGNLRDLHLEKSKDVIDVVSKNREIIPEVVELDYMTRTTFIESSYFAVEKYDVRGKIRLTNDHPFMLMGIIKGKGVLTAGGESHPLIKGDYLMLSSKIDQFQLEGDVEIITSYC